MKQPARHVLTIALVATALCADRAVANVPALRPHVAAVAGKLVDRLSVSFRRVVPSVRVVELHQNGNPAPTMIEQVETHCTVGFDVRLLPQFLRLPPPLC